MSLEGNYGNVYHTFHRQLFKNLTNVTASTKELREKYAKGGITKQSFKQLHNLNFDVQIALGQSEYFGVCIARQYFACQRNDCI